MSQLFRLHQINEHLGTAFRCFTNAFHDFETGALVHRRQASHEFAVLALMTIAYGQVTSILNLGVCTISMTFTEKDIGCVMRMLGARDIYEAKSVKYIFSVTRKYCCPGETDRVMTNAEVTLRSNGWGPLADDARISNKQFMDDSCKWFAYIGTASTSLRTPPF